MCLSSLFFNCGSQKKMRLFIWFGFWFFVLYSLPVTTGKLTHYMNKCLEN